MELKKAFIKPAENKLVRFPYNLSKILKTDGEEIVLDTYWRRRLKGGDVVIAVKKKDIQSKKSK